MTITPGGHCLEPVAAFSNASDFRIVRGYAGDCFEIFPKNEIVYLEWDQAIVKYKIPNSRISALAIDPNELTELYEMCQDSYIFYLSPT